MKSDVAEAPVRVFRPSEMSEPAVTTPLDRGLPTVQWLETFAAAVRDRDFARGREMFAPEAVGFGTVAERAAELDTLVEQQWRPVWTATRGFAFDLSTLRHGETDPIFWAAATWSSVGTDSAGRDVTRRGRCTIVLHRRGERLLAVHSHFSFMPTGAVTPDAVR